MKKSLHCKPVSVPMSLPALAQFTGDPPTGGPPFDTTCDITGPVSSLQVKLCAVDDALQILMLYPRQIPFVKDHGTL